MKTTSPQQILASQPESGALRAIIAHVLRFGERAHSLQLKLATSRHGRIALHLLVALKTGHYLWHWHGIVRELARV